MKFDLALRAKLIASSPQQSPSKNTSGAPNVNFRKISVRKMIRELEFSEHLL